MIIGIYTIYDKSAKFYNKPFYQQNDQVALRTAHELMMDGDSTIRNAPEDFTMWKIGEYHDDTAQIKPFDEFELICKFHEIRIQEIYQPQRMDNLPTDSDTNITGVA